MFRADVEGLRALAVLAVMLFHFDFDVLQGGFIGVDIFFVISGYVISKGITSSVSSGTFRYADFYTRRFRRILPALIATIVVVLLTGFLFLSSDLYKDVSLSSIYAILSLSNFYFAGTTGYFGGTAIDKPLLHMWSLSVEEQFYLLWPLILVTILSRVGKNRCLLVLSGLTLLFVIVSEIGVSLDKNYAFYMAPTRFFEFLLGAWVVIAERQVTLKRAYLHECLFVVGLVTCIAAICLYNEQMRFPGITALVPAVAVAMMIFAGANTKLSLIFSNATARFFGKTSYSLYLVHWPLVVFYKNIVGYQLDVPQKLGLLGISVVLGWTMWRYVEQPFRMSDKTLPARSDRAFYAGLATSISTVIAISYLINTNDGLLWRLDTRAQGSYLSYKKEQAKPRSCKVGPGIPPGFGCFGNQTSNAAEIALIGDSHVRNFLHGLSELSDQVGVKGIFRSTNGCPPIVGATVLSQTSSTWYDKCESSSNYSFLQANSEQINVVVLAGRWTLYTNATPFGRGDTKSELFLGIGRDDVSSLERSKDVFATQMENTIKGLVDNNKKVIVFGQVPDIGYDVERCLFRPNFFNLDLAGCSLLSSTEIKENLAFTNATLQKIAGKYPERVLFLDSSQAFCHPECEHFQGDLPLYKDSNHLMYSGSVKVVQNFSSQISAFLGKAWPAGSQASAMRHR